MPKNKGNEENTSIKDITDSLEDILEQIQNFSPGDSIYKTMKPGKRSRGQQEKTTSPETASPPKKIGRSGRRLKSITNLPQESHDISVPNTSKEHFTPRHRSSRTREKLPITSLTSIPTTSMSSITESVEQDSDQSEQETNINQTVIEAANIPNPSNPATDPLLTTSDKYTIGADYIDYLTGTSPIRSKEFNQTLCLWFKDKWNNLENPPNNLTSSMFLACILPSLTNTEKIHIMTVASNNLEIARLCSRYNSRDPELFKKDFQHWLPNVGVQGLDLREKPAQIS